MDDSFPPPPPPHGTSQDQSTRYIPVQVQGSTQDAFKSQSGTSTLCAVRVHACLVRVLSGSTHVEISCTSTLRAFVAVLNEYMFCVSVLNENYMYIAFCTFKNHTFTAFNAITSDVTLFSQLQPAERTRSATRSVNAPPPAVAAPTTTTGSKMAA